MARRRKVNYPNAPSFLAGPYPPVNVACRVANELLYRKQQKKGYLLFPVELIRIIGTVPFLMFHWLGLWVEHEKVDLKSITVIDIRHLWALVRWVQLSEVFCFDLAGLEMITVEGCVGDYYDILDVLDHNGYDISELSGSE